MPSSFLMQYLTVTQTNPEPVGAVSAKPSATAAGVTSFPTACPSGQIKLRRIDGWRRIAAVVSQHTRVAA